MPKQVLPNAESFASFRKSMLARGFREIYRDEFVKNFTRLELRAPSPRRGREVGFIFSANGYDVVVWTTYIEAEQMARKSDAGRVLIKDGDRVVYHSRPKHRTKNFLHNLLLAAAIARSRVIHRPLCPKCGAYMHVRPGKGLKARYYRCQASSHPTPVNLPWDHGLPDEVMKKVIKSRRDRKPHVDKLAAKGLKPGAALKKRRKWTVGKPQNRV